MASPALAPSNFCSASPTPLLVVRPLTTADVAQLLRIQRLCYGAEFIEGAEVFTRRLQAAHHCSWAAQQHGRVVAYVAAYWSRPGKVTPLQGEFVDDTDAEAESVLYLHDLAVEPSKAGQGIAAQLLQTAVSHAQARGVQRAALVAVQGAEGYWRRQGFGPSQPTDVTQKAHLASYGAGAQYMERGLG